MTLSSSSQGVWFPQWAEVLARVRLKDLERWAYRSAIMDYLGFCKRSRQRATVESARKFMEQVEGKRLLTLRKPTGRMPVPPDGYLPNPCVRFGRLGDATLPLYRLTLGFRVTRPSESVLQICRLPVVG